MRLTMVLIHRKRQGGDAFYCKIFIFSKLNKVINLFINNKWEDFSCGVGSLVM